MTTSEILCLANSPKEHAHCIAGIDLTTRRFVRSVAAEAQAIPNDWASVDGKVVQPLKGFPASRATRPIPSTTRATFSGRSMNAPRKLPSASVNSVGPLDRVISQLNGLACVYPCQRFARDVATTHA